MTDLNININLMIDTSKLRSKQKKNVMIDGESESPPLFPNVMTGGRYFINADSKITDQPGKKIVDILKDPNRSPMLI